MLGIGVKVKKKEAEKVRRKLKELGIIDKNRKVVKEGNYVIFPVLKEPPLKIEGAEIVFVEFPEVKRIESYKDLAKVPESLRSYLPTSFDVIGDIAIVKIPDELSGYEREIGEAMIKAYKSIKAVFMDRGVKGRYRIRELEHLAGEQRTETIFREYGLRFKVDVAKVYASPRLGEEHKKFSEYVSEGEVIFDMFSGYGPFSIFAAKKGAMAYATDINPYAIHYLYENSIINHVEDRVIGIVSDCLKVKGIEADHLVMNLPHSAKRFLPKATERLGKEGWLHIYSICDDPKREEGEIRKILEKEFEILKVEISGGKPYSPKESFYGFHIKLKRIARNTFP